VEFEIVMAGEIRRIDQAIDNALGSAIYEFAEQLLKLYEIDDVGITFDEDYGAFLDFYRDDERIASVELAVRVTNDYFCWRDINAILKDIIDVVRKLRSEKQ